MINLIFQQNQRYRLAKHKKDVFKTNKRVTNYFSDIPDELDVTWYNDEPRKFGGYASDELHEHLLHSVLPNLLKLKPSNIPFGNVQFAPNPININAHKLPNLYGTEYEVFPSNELNDGRHLENDYDRFGSYDRIAPHLDRLNSTDYTNPHLIKKLSPLEFHLTNGDLKSPRDNAVLHHLSRQIVDKLNHPLIDYLYDQDKEGREELTNHVYQELLNYMSPEHTQPLHEFLDRPLDHKYTPKIKVLGKKNPMYQDFNNALIKHLSPEE